MIVLEKIKPFSNGQNQKQRQLRKKRLSPLRQRWPRLLKRRWTKVAQNRKIGPVGGNQGAGVFLLITASLIKVRTPPVTGTLGIIGLSGRAH